MDDLQLWLTTIKTWYNEENANNIPPLIAIITATPACLFTIPNTDIHVQQNNEEAMAYWLDSCHKISQFHCQQQPQLAFAYLQLPYAKLQALVCDPQQSATTKRWGLKKLDNIMITLLEFCQCQPPHSQPQQYSQAQQPQQHSQAQQPQYWQQQGRDLIDLHVQFMAAQQHLNLQY